MEKVKILVGWSENNYSAVCDSINGVVIDTNKDLEELKKSFAEVFKFHVEESLEDGDKLPDYMVAGDYELEFELQISAILHKYDGILTRAALSRVTGINQKQLGHYMSGHRNPRPKQRERIVNGIKDIGKELLNVV